MEFFEIIILIIIAIIVIVVLFSFTTVFEYQRGVKYKYGRFKKVLHPGLYIVFKPSTKIKLVDIRQTVTKVQGQEIITFDGVTFKINLSARYEIADIEKAINKIENYQEALHLALQAGLRIMISALPADEIIEKRNEHSTRLFEILSVPVQELGIKLLTVEIKDIILPGAMKNIFAQVVKARKEGLAILEKARGETAALRNLANAAKMLEANPVLIQLRAIQQLNETSGSTIILNFDRNSNVLPIKDKPNQKPDNTMLEQ